MEFIFDSLTISGIVSIGYIILVLVIITDCCRMKKDKRRCRDEDKAP